MSDDGPQTIPAAWRAKVDDLVARGQSARAIELLEMWCRQHVVTPWAMQLLGRLHLEAGDRRAAGRAFFWSGQRGDATEQACVDAFLGQKRMTPLRLVRTLPQRARLPIERMPGALPDDLRSLGVTDSVVDRANRASSRLGEWLMWPVFGLLLVSMVVGLVTIARWVVGLFA